MTSREDILACAEEEGSVVVQTSTAEFEAFEELFETDYPFIDMEWAELSGAATERLLLELESGAAGRYDVGYPAPEAYGDIAQHMNWDILGMAEAGILDIPVEVIDADSRTVLAAGHTGIAFAYNSELIDESELPTSWEELSDPRWSRENLGLAMDVDLNNVSVLATSPDWGIERVVELMEDIAANEPIYVDGHTSAALLVQSGEVAASPFVNLHSLMREVDKDPDGPLQVHFIEPVPIRASEAYGVYDDTLAEAPCSALLFIEWISNDDDAQALLDADPLQASLFWADSRMAEMIGDLEPTVADPETVAALPDWIQQIQGAAGFPQVSG
jgi:ABC-type Fe3+ transport system substrate-binding protein